MLILNQSFNVVPCFNTQSLWIKSFASFCFSFLEIQRHSVPFHGILCALDSYHTDIFQVSGDWELSHQPVFCCIHRNSCHYLEFNLLNTFCPHPAASYHHSSNYVILCHKHLLIVIFVRSVPRTLNLCTRNRQKQSIFIPFPCLLNLM